jgi:hypothetical protein
MANGDVVLYKDRLYVIYSYKMDPDFIVINPLDPQEEDDLYATLFVGKVKFLGIFKDDIPGCKTLNDVRKYYPELLI